VTAVTVPEGAILPVGPSGPRLLQALPFALNRNRAMHKARERYGTAFTVATLNMGRMVMLAEPAEVKQMFLLSPDAADTPDINLGSVLGPGSLFAITGEDHKTQRRLLTPPFHGRRLRAYEKLIEQAAEREMASWPTGRPFPVMSSTMRITLNAILGTVFGAEGAELDELRALLPSMVRLGSILAVLPISRRLLGERGPWARFRRYRARYDAIVDRLIELALPGLDGRDDVLAMLLQSRYDDGTPMSRAQIADQLLTLLSAGHETTATTLAWAVERIRRHPELLARLAAGDDELREATLIEVQRTRPVIEMTSRQVRAPFVEIGRWRIPRGMVVTASISLLHDAEELFPNAAAFDPDRFVGAKPDTYGWIPFGGGVRRCIGAAFATMEMNVVLRTMLRDFDLEPTGEPAEKPHNRGIAIAPAKGGLAVVRRRS